MYHYLFAALLLLHGLIHIRGFMQGRGKWTTEHPAGDLHIAVSSRRSRLVAAGWLAATLFLAVAAVLCALQHTYWGLAAFCALVFSQLLIFSAWKRAKAGTWLNLLLILPCLVQLREVRQQRAVAAEVRSWKVAAKQAPDMIVSRERVSTMPVSVQRWLSWSGVIGQRVPHFVHLRQQGWMRTGRNGPWMPASAEQYFTIPDPSFLWYAKVARHPLFYFRGLDRLYQGSGTMNIAVWSLVPVAGGRGPAFDQGSMLRFLGELVWFPAAAVSPYLHWEGIDDSTARATMYYGSASVSGVYHFDGRGRFLRFTARRYMSGDDGPSLQDWDIPANAWRAMNGVLMPVAGDVIWHLPEGDLNYYKWQITQIDYE